MTARTTLPRSIPRLPRGSKNHPKHGQYAGSPDGTLWRQTRQGTWVEVFEPVCVGKTARPLSVVLECFRPKPGGKIKVGFLDGDRSNRTVENLVWVPNGHPDELRRLVIDRVTAGDARKTVADEVGVPYRTVCEWTKHLARCNASHVLRIDPGHPPNETAPCALPKAQAS